MPDVLDGRTYEIDEKTGIRKPIDAEVARAVLNEHIATLYLLDVYTHIAPPTAADLLKFANKFVECLRIYKSESNRHANHVDIGKQK